MLSGSGSAQRWWYRRCAAEAERVRAAQQAQAADIKAQLGRFRDEVRRLPPEGRSAVDDFLKAQGGGMAGNPLVLGLAKFAPAKGESIEEQVVAGAQAVALRWRSVERWLVRGLWLAVATAALFAVSGMNAWAAMPGAFYIAPCILDLAGFFLRLQDAPESEPVLAAAAGALAAPAASILVVSLFAAVG